MNRSRFIQVFPVLLWLGLSSCDARGDGGVVRLREAQGPFVVTIFTASEIVENSPAEVSVMVQRRDSSDAILDATVNLTLTAPASSVVEPVEQVCSQSEAAPWSTTSGPHRTQFTVPATRQQASNKLLYAGLVKFDAAGAWRLQALIECGRDSVKMGCNIPVGPPPGRLAGLLPYLLLPPLMVMLFAVNQGLRRKASVPPPTAMTRPTPAAATPRLRRSPCGPSRRTPA
jgi:hypothetical protein